MASWMIHFRVAQQLFQKRNIEPIHVFILGNIAPDSGIPSKDGSGFIPDAAVSHFRSLDENGIKDIHEEQFIEQYFTPAHRLSYSQKEYAFFLGYLTHLLTDKIWAREIAYSAREKLNALFHANRELFWQTVKKDWYDLDFLFLKSNPSFEAFRIYCESKDVGNTYVDFFSENAFAERRQFIIDFYKTGVANVEEHDTYLSKEDLDRFVACAANEILAQIPDIETDLRKKAQK